MINRYQLKRFMSSNNRKLLQLHARLLALLLLVDCALSPCSKNTHERLLSEKRLPHVHTLPVSHRT